MQEWDWNNIGYVRKKIKLDLLKEFDWLGYSDEIRFVIHGGYPVVDLNDLDVNFKEWHNRELDGHGTFYFYGKGYAYLTENNYEEFKQVLRDYEKEYIKGE